MQVVESLATMPSRYRGGVIAAGGFGAFHRGHQAVLARARARAGREGRPLIVTTGRPPVDPGAYSTGGALTALEQRLRLFRREGVDVVAMDDGGQGPARLDLALAAAQAAAVVTERRPSAEEAGPATPSEAGTRIEYVVRAADAEGALTSDRVRAALSAGDCRTATTLLGRPFAVEGVVQHGHALGRTIGFPTANLLMGDYARPAYGVYAVRGRLACGTILDGVANLGIRPIMETPEELLEPYFFDFTGDLYDQVVEVLFVRRLRGEARLGSFEELATWIRRDCEEARQVLGETAHVA